MRRSIEKYENTKLPKNVSAPGAPGSKPVWSSGAKTAVGTALSIPSRMWFTVAKGVVNEVYFPDIDCANFRGLKFMVTNGTDFFSDQEDDAEHKTRWIAPGVPGAMVESVCKQGKYRIEAEIITDPSRDVLDMSILFESKVDEDLQLYAFCNPHVGDQGADNEAWVGEYKGLQLMFAERDGLCIAAGCSSGFMKASVGYRGSSDGLEELKKHKRLTRIYTEAKQGNVIWLAQIDWRKTGGRFRCVVAGGGSPAEAALQARMALMARFEDTRKCFVAPWQAEQEKFEKINGLGEIGSNYRTSFAVLRTHESKRFPGGFVASLSIPWGFARGDSDTGGYHVLWPRDMCETALALLAAGDVESARRAMHYLSAVQEPDGNMSQNMWLNGVEHWTSIQMDGTAFPVLLADALRRGGHIRVDEFWEVIRRTASFLVKVGPYTKEDRWEANAGYSPYTMAVEVAALLAAAEFADEMGERAIAEFLRSTADAWNDEIDELTYVTGTSLAKHAKVDGYYVRIMPIEALQARSLKNVITSLVNHHGGAMKHHAVNIASPDALALVRFGLRAPDDPRMLHTVKVIDRTLKTETATGPVWHRYTDDGYGEHADGAPFKQWGIGRGWPLLAGERAHYEIALGNFAGADELRRVMERQTSECGLMPEQVWDSKDIPKRLLFNGHPTGSGMPLVWAHAEYISLLRSIKDRGVWNCPPQTYRRYVVERRVAGFQIWTEEQQRARLAEGKMLRIDSQTAERVEWSVDGWKTKREVALTDSQLGVKYAILPVATLRSGARVDFRLLPGDKRYRVTVD